MWKRAVMSNRQGTQREGERERERLTFRRGVGAKRVRIEFAVARGRVMPCESDSKRGVGHGGKESTMKGRIVRGWRQVRVYVCEKRERERERERERANEAKS